MSSYLKLLFKSSYTNITHVVLGKATSTTRNASLKILKEQWRNITLDIGLIMCPADGLTSTSSLIETAGISSVHLRVCWEMQQTFCQWHMLSWRSWITCATSVGSRHHLMLAAVTLTPAKHEERKKRQWPPPVASFLLLLCCTCC